MKKDFFDLIVFDDAKTIEDKTKLYFYYDLLKEKGNIVFDKIFENKEIDNYLIKFAEKRNDKIEKFKTRNQTVIINKS